MPFILRIPQASPCSRWSSARGRCRSPGDSVGRPWRIFGVETSVCVRRAKLAHFARTRGHVSGGSLDLFAPLVAAPTGIFASIVLEEVVASAVDQLRGDRAARDVSHLLARAGREAALLYAAVSVPRRADGRGGRSFAGGRDISAAIAIVARLSRDAPRRGGCTLHGGDCADGDSRSAAAVAARAGVAGGDRDFGRRSVGSSLVRA